MLRLNKLTNEPTVNWRMLTMFHNLDIISETLTWVSAIVSGCDVIAN